jgi:hypothetical protein
MRRSAEGGRLLQTIRRCQINFDGKPMGVLGPLCTNDELRRSFNEPGFVTGPTRSCHSCARFTRPLVSATSLLLEGQTGAGKPYFRVLAIELAKAYERGMLTEGGRTPPGMQMLVG